MNRRIPVFFSLLLIVSIVVAASTVPTGTALAQGGDSNVQHDVFTEPLDDAESARIVIDIPLANATVKALQDSTSLIEADLTYIGEIEFYTVGESEKYVSLTNPVHTLPITSVRAELPWIIGLSPAIPLALEINNGVGSHDFDLTGLQLESVSVHTGVGEVAVTLSAEGESYPADIAMGTGDVTITVPDGAAADLSVSGGVGNLTVAVGPEVAIRVEANWGVGEIDLPDGFEQLRLNTGIVGGSGMWQTPGYEDAARQVALRFQGGVGNLTIARTTAAE